MIFSPLNLQRLKKIINLDATERYLLILRQDKGGLSSERSLSTTLE